jgi:phosphodiesterase/alkaline phosphatase D-like protein
MPQAIDQPGTSTTESGDVCCDPTLAADPLGNIWFGGLTLANGAGNPSRIVVNRVASGGSTFQAQTVGLPVGSSGTQDKPMMTIDNTPTSPTFGRLYVVWDAPAGAGVRIVVSTCDTRPGGVSHPENCDNADNWTAPARITPTIGSYIYADVAVGPTGKAYVTWWDYSSANAIRGATCDGATVNCATAANWSGAQNIALLDSTGGAPVPFACPILAQPGGRAAPDPQVDVDHSGGANNGRVYVTWGDLRPGSGSTRCADATTPAATHLSWDSFVALGAVGGAFPGPAVSATVGTRLLTDGEGGGQSPSDDWFPWLAVDQSTGMAWADFYSTRDDASRNTTNFYARSVTASGSTLTAGPLNKVSTGASNYSATPCCQFDNDYGDYTGLDAAGGVAYPVWSDNSTGDGEAFTFVSTLGPQKPTVVTGSFNGVGQSTATVNGTVNPNGQATTYHFEYGTTTAYGSTAPIPDGSAGSSGAVQSESQPLSGLSPNTTYHYRLVATNATGTTQGLDQQFTTAPAPVAPTVTTAAASGVDDTDATLNGSVNPQGQNVTYHFEYGTTASYGQSTANQALPASNSTSSVSASLSGLTAGTTYHYRLVASNATGPTNGADVTFTTTSPPPPNPPPSVVTGGTASPTQTSVTLDGTVNPNGQPTTYRFEYGTTASYGSQAPASDADAGSGSADVPVTADLSGLSPNTQYHYRLVAINGSGTTHGTDASFTTLGPAPPPPSAPTAVTGAATGVTASAATLNATINPNGQPTTYHFDYGTTTGYGSVTGELPAGSASSDQAFAVNLSGLAPSTTYHFRVVAANATPTTVNGDDVIFTTAATAPPGGGGGSGTPATAPAGGGGTTTRPAPGATRAAFTLSLTFPSQRLGTVLARRGVRASAGCAAVCRLAARLTAPGGTARTLGLTRGRGAVELGRAAVARAAARRTSLSIPLSRRALRALAGRTTVSIELRVGATPLDGRRPVTRAVRLTLRRRGTSPTVKALRASAAASPVWLGWDALGALR